jgi:hydrogenase nickel incorporation protein HypB
MDRDIEVYEDVMERNARLAAEVNDDLTRRGVFAVNVMGSPGAGKTTVLLRTLPLLGVPVFVIEGDIQSDIDTVALEAAGIPAVQINTGGACHLDAPLIAAALPGDPAGCVFIENIGNLVCPAEFMIGEHAKLLIVDAAGGFDKPYKYPLAFERADAIVLNKADLAPHVGFDMDKFTAGVRKLNKTAPVFPATAKTGDGIAALAGWIMDKSKAVLAGQRT